MPGGGDSVATDTIVSRKSGYLPTWLSTLVYAACILVRRAS